MRLAVPASTCETLQLTVYVRTRSTCCGWQNGGPVAGSAGASHANNFPLRGGKHSNWEGGIRVVAFASGGIIEPSRHGVILRGIMHNAGRYQSRGTGVVKLDAALNLYLVL